MRDVIHRLRSDATLRAISTNTAWLVADRLLGLVLSVFVTIEVARYLGPGDFGLLSYAAAFVGIAAPIAQLGLDSIVVRDLVAEPESRGEILGTAFGLMLGTAAVLAPSVMVVALMVADDSRTITLISILAVQYLFQTLLIIDSRFRAELRSKYTVWSMKTGLAVNAIATILFIRRGAQIEAFAVAMLLEVVVTAMALIVFARVAGRGETSWVFRRVRARRLLRQSLPLLVSVLAGTLSARINFILLGELGSEHQVGVYSAASRMVELWYFLPMAIVVSVFPSLMRSRQSLPPIQYERRVQALYDLVAALGYAVTIPMTLIAGPLATTIFGPAFSESGRVMAVLMWTFVLVSIGAARSHWLVAEQRNAFYMAAVTGGAAVSVAAAFFLIPAAGASGAAAGLIISQLFVVLFSSLFLRDMWPSFRHVVLAMLVPLRPGALRQAFVLAARGEL